MAKLLYDCSMYGLKAGDEVEVKYEEDNKMFKLGMVKVGDYVEKWDGTTGYVTQLNVLGKNRKTQEHCRLVFCWDGTDGKKYCLSDKHEKNIGAYYKQIGSYKFTKPEKKNKIEPITVGKDGNILFYHGEDITQYTSNDITNIMQKLNEVIAYINKQEE